MGNGVTSGLLSGGAPATISWDHRNGSGLTSQHEPGPGGTRSP